MHSRRLCIVGLTLLAICILGGSPKAQPLPPQYSVGTGHWYQVVNLSSSLCWDACRDSSIALGGYLAVVTSPIENAFILALDDAPVYSYLGGYEAPEGVWQWVNGESWIYTNWWVGQPGNEGGNEDRLVMVNRATDEQGGYWHDLGNCSGQSLAFVIEYESSPFCDGFEDPASLSDWTIHHAAQRVATPVNSGSASVEFGGVSGDCEGIMRRKDFSALYGEYGASFRQDNTAGGTAIYIQVQPDLGGQFNTGPCYRLGSDATGAQSSQLQLVRRFGAGSNSVLGSISPVPYSVGDWVRVFVRRFAADSLEFGYEYNGLIYSQMCVDPDPIMTPGGFSVSSCSDGGSANYVDDVCYFPYQVVTDTLTEVVTDTLCEAISACGTTQEDVDNSGSTNVQDVVKVINAAFRGQAETLDSCNAVAKP